MRVQIQPNMPFWLAFVLWDRGIDIFIRLIEEQNSKGLLHVD